MSYVYRRPMFRKGGSAGEGITSGLQSRLGFATGKSTKERLMEAVGTRPARQNFNDFLINFGLDIASRSPTGNIFTTVAQSAQEPYKQFAANRTGEQDLMRKIGLEAETLDIGQEQAMELQALKNLSSENQSTAMRQAKEMVKQGLINPDTQKVYTVPEAFEFSLLSKTDEARASVTDQIAGLTNSYVNQGDDYDIAQNKATWDISIREKLSEAVEPALIGGKLPTNKTQREKLLKKESSIGKYFYDIKDGKVKKFNGIIEKDGQKGFDFTEVDQTTFEDVIPTGEEVIEKEKIIGTSESETKLTREQAEVEAEARGLVLIPPASGRGSSSTFRRQNPNAISIVELQEIIDKENMADMYEGKKTAQRIR
jgi:hypothetical protein